MSFTKPVSTPVFFYPEMKEEFIKSDELNGFSKDVIRIFHKTERLK
jgi:hypothetical protein